MNKKIVIDLALKSETGVYITDSNKFISIAPKEIVDLINHISHYLCFEGTIGDNQNYEVYIELPLFSKTKQWNEFAFGLKNQLLQDGFIHIYMINVGQWRNAIARKLGFKSDDDFTNNRLEMPALTIAHINRAMTKGYRESKVLPMYYCEINGFTFRTEDEADCKAIADVANPEMEYQVVNEAHKHAILTRKKSLRQKYALLKKTRINQVKDAKNAKIIVLKQENRRLKRIIKQLKKGKHD